jgi:gas vesicle protein
MSENGNGSGNLTGFVMGAVVGAAVGAGVALLLAPSTGKEARSWLARNTREIKDRTTNALKQAKDTVRRETEIAGREAKEFASAHDLNH